MSAFDIETATYDQINRENSRLSYIEQQKSHVHAQEMRELNKIKLTNELQCPCDQELKVLRQEIETMKMDNLRGATAIDQHFTVLTILLLFFIVFKSLLPQT